MANRKIAHAIRVALMTAGAAGAGLYVPSVAAQEALEEIVVTGSRIARRDAVAESPIFTVDQESMRVSGFTTVDQFLNTLPQIVPSTSSQSNNPSSNGRAFVDLRGLGPERNLVLIDGRRAMGQASGGTIVDVNTIPAALIERVEVITGGAAATYGADAVAGVVNFIMKKSFDGVALDAQYRLTQEGDGEEWGSDLTFGGDFADGRGSSVFNASYFKRQPMGKGARSFSEQASGATGIFPNGSWAPGANAPSQAAIDAFFGPDQCNANGGSRGYGFNPDGTPFCTGVTNDATRNVVNYNGPESDIAQAFFPDSFSYNFEPDNILILPLERWNIYGATELEVNDNFKPYAKFIFTNYNSPTELAPTPGGGFVMPVANPFIPDSIAALAASRADPAANLSINKRFNAVGGRASDNNHDVWQLVTGARGDITGSWEYDAYASWGRSVLTEIQSGNIRIPRVNELLGAADGGTSICAGGLNFFGAQEISAECAAYIGLDAKNLTTVEQGVLEAVATGDLFELPAGTVQSAVGASYRHLDFDFAPDSGLQPGIVAGFNEQLPVSGRLWYTDFFAEAVVPIVSDVPFIQNLSTTLGVRTTDNNIFGSDESYKITFDWTVNDLVRARGGFQHAIRSPNIAELFDPQLNNFPDIEGQDPCNFDSSFRTGPNAAQVSALCAAQGAVSGAPGFSQPFDQAQSIVGGNPDLTPEQADTWTVGFVLTPQFESALLERLTVTVDYFSIKIDDVVASVDALTTIQRCFNREGANPTFDPNNQWCSQFTRDQADGRIIELEQFSQNQAIWETAGIDTTVNWGLGVGPGDLAFSLVVSWLDKFEQQVTSIDPTNDFAGTIGSDTGTAFPEWKGTLQTTYSLANWRFQSINRYVGSMDHELSVTIPDTTATGTDSTMYWDLAATYDVTENISLRAGVNNVANQQPRLYSPNVQANTDPSQFDVLGRRWFVGFNWRM